MRPTSSDVHVNRPLTEMSLALFQGMNGFVANKVFPVVKSDNKSDTYYKFQEEYWNRDDLKARAPGTEAEIIGYGLTTDSFECMSWDGKVLIDDQQRQNADSPLDLDLQASSLAMLKARIKSERLFAAQYFVGGVWTNYDYDGVSGSPSTGQVKQWNDAASTPIKDVANGSLAVLAATGIRPNKLVVGAAVHEALKYNPEILARITGMGSNTNPALVTREMLAAIFEVEQYLVMESVYDSSNQGATSAPTFIGGKRALLAYAAPRPGLFTPSAGYTFAWTKRVGANTEGFRVKKYREEPKESDAIEVQLAIAHKLTAVKLGAFWDTVVA